MTSSKYLPKGQVERILVPTDFSPEKHSILSEYFLGHTLVEIMAGAPCPVLTIRQWK